MLAGYCCLQSKMQGIRRFISNPKTLPHQRRAAMRQLKKVQKQHTHEKQLQQEAQANWKTILLLDENASALDVLRATVVAQNRERQHEDEYAKVLYAQRYLLKLLGVTSQQWLEACNKYRSETHTAEVP